MVKALVADTFINWTAYSSFNCICKGQLSIVVREHILKSAGVKFKLPPFPYSLRRQWQTTLTKTTFMRRFLDHLSHFLLYYAVSHMGMLACFLCCFHPQDVLIVGEALQLLVLCLQLRTQLMGKTNFLHGNYFIFNRLFARINKTKQQTVKLVHFLLVHHKT